MSFLNQTKLQEFYDTSVVEEFLTVARAHVLHRPGERLNCQINPENKDKKEIYLQSENEMLGLVGWLHTAKNRDKFVLETPENRPRLISLNIGSFGLNSLHPELDTAYKQNLSKFVDYVGSVKHSTLILNLQDVPNDPDLINQITELGFDFYFFPSIFFHLGKFKNRPDSGLAVLINQRLLGYDLNLLNASLSFHQGGFPDYHKAYPKYKTRDLLLKPLTLYFTLEERLKKEGFLIVNTYISPFSTKAHRFESIKDSISLTQQMIDQFSKFRNEYTKIVRFTGDFNLYGHQTLHGPLGLSYEPWNFLPSLFGSLISGFRPFGLFKSGKLFEFGKNYPNLQEVSELKSWLKKQNFGISLDINQELHSSFNLFVQKLAPTFLKSFFQGAGIGWIVDICLYPVWSKKFQVWYENQPFGDEDHETLVVQL